jgi:hypothetical protein
VVAATILHFLCNAELANEEKGTRSSPKKGIYMANVGLQRKHAQGKEIYMPLISWLWRT